MSSPHVLFLIGPPCCGKSKQMEALSRELGIPGWYAGQALRDAKTDPRFAQINKQMEGGGNVSVELKIPIFHAALDALDIPTNGVVIDGYPREEAELQFFDGYFAKNGIQLTAAIHIDVPEEVCWERWKSGRAGQSGRADDTPEAQNKRYETFRENAPIVLSHFKQHLITVNGDQPPKDVTKDILSFLRHGAYDAITQR